MRQAIMNVTQMHQFCQNIKKKQIILMLGFHGMKAHGSCGGKTPSSLHFAARLSPSDSKCPNPGKTAPSTNH